MRRAGLRVVVLFTESPYDQAKELAVARLVDGGWTNERSALPAFQAANALERLSAAWLEPDDAPARPTARDETVAAHDVVFVGTAFRERVAWLSAIDWTGIDLGLYGSWEALGSRHPLRQCVRGAQVSNARTAALYRRAKIGLNLYRTSEGWGRHAPAIAHAESLNPRAYELAACGVFSLSTYRRKSRTSSAIWCRPLTRPPTPVRYCGRGSRTRRVAPAYLPCCRPVWPSRRGWIDPPASSVICNHSCAGRRRREIHMARYHGNKGVVYGSVSGTGVAAQMASLSKWSLNMATDKVDVTRVW